VAQVKQVVECFCLPAPHAQKSRDRHDGQRRWPLDGWKVRTHSAQTRLFMASLYRNQIHVLAHQKRVTELIGASRGLLEAPGNTPQTDLAQRSPEFGGRRAWLIITILRPNTG
jgi:hypothetical protein